MASAKSKSKQRRRSSKNTASQGGLKRPDNTGSSSPEAAEQPETRRRKVLKFVGVTAATVLIGAGLNAIVNFYILPQQSVRQQQAVSGSQATADAQSPALLVQDVIGADGESGYGGYSEASEVVYTTSQILTYASVGVGGQPNHLLPPDPTKAVIGHQTGNRINGQQQTVSSINFTLVGNHNKPVRITAVTVDVLKRSAPPAGTLFLGGSEGDIPDTTMGFDLDNQNDNNGKNLTTGPDPQIAPGDYMKSHPITLQKNESVSFLMLMFAKNGLFQYVLRIKTDDGQTITVDSKGHPWTVASFAASYQKAFRIDLNFGTKPEECTPASDCLKYLS